MDETKQDTTSASGKSRDFRRAFLKYLVILGVAQVASIGIRWFGWDQGMHWTTSSAIKLLSIAPLPAMCIAGLIDWRRGHFSKSDADKFR